MFRGPWATGLAVRRRTTYAFVRRGVRTREWTRANERADSVVMRLGVRCHASVAEVHRAPHIDATLVGPTQGWPLHATEPANTQGVRGSVLEDPRARDSSSAWESLAGVPRPSTGSGPAATAPRGCRCAPSGELVPTSPEPPHGPPGPLHRMSSRTQSGQASGVANAQ